MRLGRAGSPQGQDKDSESDCCSATRKVTSGLHVPSSEWFFFLTLVVIHLLTICFSDGSEGKESTCSVEYLGSVPGLGRSPGGGHGNPLQYSCLENRHGQRSLAGCSPWGCKKSDMTERLNTHKHTSADHRTFVLSLLSPGRPSWTTLSK